MSGSDLAALGLCADASLEDGFMSLDDILDASAVYHLPADFLGGVGDGGIW